MYVNGDAFGINLSNAKSQTKKSTDEDSKLQKYLKYFTDSWTYAQQNFHQRWERNWKAYNNQHSKKNHPGTIEAFVPMVNSTVNTIEASLFGSIPSIKYIPDHPDQEADTEVLNEIYADNARRDSWARKNRINGRQGLITGNFCAYYEWVADKDGGYVHKTIVPVRDMILDPNATTREDWRYVGRRFFTSLKRLKQEKIFDFSTGKYVPRYKNLDKVTPGQDGGQDGFESDKVKKDQALGATAPLDDDSVSLIEIWTHKEVVVIANLSVIIEERENPHYAMERSKYEQRKAEWQLQREINFSQGLPDIGEFDEVFDEEEAGLLPFAHGCDYEDISQVYGSSDVDIIVDQQDLLNTITELNIEAILYQLFPEKTVDPKFADQLDNLSPAPGKVYPLPSGAMTWNTPPAVPTNAFAERQNIKDEIREASAISQISKGVSATDTTTATEIKAMLGQADVRIQEKAQNLADGFFFDEAKIFLKFLQLYAPSTLWYRTVDDAGVKFESVNMERFLGDYTPMVTLDITKKLEDAEAKDSALNAFQMMIADPTNNLEAIKRIMYPKIVSNLSADEIDEILTPQQPEAPEVAQPEAPAPEMMPEEMPMEEAPIEEQPIEEMPTEEF